MRVYHILPSWAPMAAITVFKRVFAQKIVSETTLQHEAVHIAQQEKDGWRFYARYTFSRKWRAWYEAQGYKVQYRAGYNIDWLARVLSGPLYFWPCSHEEAVRLIKEP